MNTKFYPYLPIGFGVLFYLPLGAETLRMGNPLWQAFLEASLVVGFWVLMFKFTDYTLAFTDDGDLTQELINRSNSQRIEIEFNRLSEELNAELLFLLPAPGPHQLELVEQAVEDALQVIRDRRMAAFENKTCSPANAPTEN
jgi:hypothetical protein